MSLFQRLKKIKDENEAKARQEYERQEVAEKKRRKEIEDYANKISNYLKENVKPILDEVNQALADGEGWISEDKYETNRTPELELK